MFILCKHTSWRRRTVSRALQNKLAYPLCIQQHVRNATAHALAHKHKGTYVHEHRGTYVCSHACTHVHEHIGTCTHAHEHRGTYAHKYKGTCMRAHMRMNPLRWSALRGDPYKSTSTPPHALYPTLPPVLSVMIHLVFERVVYSNGRFLSGINQLHLVLKVDSMIGAAVFAFGHKEVRVYHLMQQCVDQITRLFRK